MNRTTYSVDGAPPPGGAYSQAVRRGPVLAVAGQTGIDPATGILANGLEGQTRQALSNLLAVLEAAGAAWDSVIKTTCFLQDIREFSYFDRVYAELVPVPTPARSTVGVQLAGDLLVEIEALAIFPE